MQRGYRSRCLQPNRASLALVPHGHRFTLHMGYARSEAPGGPGSSGHCSGQGVLTPASPALVLVGAQRHREPRRTSKRSSPGKLVFLFARCADGLTRTLNSFPTWHQRKVSLANEMMNTGSASLPGRLLWREMFLRCPGIGACGEALAKSCNAAWASLADSSFAAIKSRRGQICPTSSSGVPGAEPCWQVRGEGWRRWVETQKLRGGEEGALCCAAAILPEPSAASSQFVAPILSLPFARNSQSNGSRRFSLRCRVSLLDDSLPPPELHLQALIDACHDARLPRARSRSAD